MAMKDYYGVYFFISILFKEKRSQKSFTKLLKLLEENDIFWEDLISKDAFAEKVKLKLYSYKINKPIKGELYFKYLYLFRIGDNIILVFIFKYDGEVINGNYRSIAQYYYFPIFDFLRKYFDEIENFEELFVRGFKNQWIVEISKTRVEKYASNLGYDNYMEYVEPLDLDGNEVYFVDVFWNIVTKNAEYARFTLVSLAIISFFSAVLYSLSEDADQTMNSLGKLTPHNALRKIKKNLEYYGEVKRLHKAYKIFVNGIAEDHFRKLCSKIENYIEAVEGKLEALQNLVPSYIQAETMETQMEIIENIHDLTLASEEEGKTLNRLTIILAILTIIDLLEGLDIFYTKVLITGQITGEALFLVVAIIIVAIVIIMLSKLWKAVKPQAKIIKTEIKLETPLKTNLEKLMKSMDIEKISMVGNIWEIDIRKGNTKILLYINPTKYNEGTVEKVIAIKLTRKISEKVKSEIERIEKQTKELLEQIK